MPGWTKFGRALAVAAAIGNRFHAVSGDVQSAGSGVEVHSDAHDVFEIPAK